MWQKIEICYGKGQKHCGKRRKCWLPAFSPFSTMFSKDSFPRVIKSSHCAHYPKFKDPQEGSFWKCCWKNLRKGDNAVLNSKVAFSAFSTMFANLSKTGPVIWNALNLFSAMLLILMTISLEFVSLKVYVKSWEWNFTAGIWLLLSIIQHKILKKTKQCTKWSSCL